MSIRDFRLRLSETASLSQFGVGHTGISESESRFSIPPERHFVHRASTEASDKDSRSVWKVWLQHKIEETRLDSPWKAAHQRRLDRGIQDSDRSQKDFKAGLVCLFDMRQRNLRGHEVKRSRINIRLNYLVSVQSSTGTVFLSNCLC